MATLKIGLVTVDETQICYAGLRAYDNGLSLSDNPFPPYEVAHHVWRKGWLRASEMEQSQPTMTDYQLAIIVCLRAQPGYIFGKDEDDGVELEVAKRMVRLGWLVDIGGDRFAISKKGDTTYYETMRQRNDSRLKASRDAVRSEPPPVKRPLLIRFREGINLEVRLDISAKLPGRREIWRFHQECEYWIGGMVAHDTERPILYTLFLDNEQLNTQFPDRLINVPEYVFEVIEARKLVNE